MLRSLHVRDFAIVREVEVEFGPGLTTVSGETGAGKSLMVDALMLVSGARAEAAMVRHGAERAELTAGFDVADAPAARAWLRTQELDEGDDCALRRVIRADGGSRAWINGRPATVGQLAEIGALLVEIHGQHEHQALLRRAEQLALLDAFGAHADTLEAVRSLATQWRDAGRRLETLGGEPEQVAQRVAYLRHQLDELDAESIAADDVAALLATHRRQANAAALLQGCDAALARLDADDAPSAGGTLRRVHADLLRLAEHEPALGDVAATVDAAVIQLDEATAALARVRDELDLDPARLEESERRLTRLHDLARKHRVDIEQLAARREAIADELSTLEHAETAAAELRRQRDALRGQWSDVAEALTSARREAAQRLSESVSALMSQLGMGGGRFVAALETNEAEEPDPQGRERVEFEVSANAGQPPRPLRKVASGGELSRIGLAIEVAALGMDAVPTMVFDEVDAGIGGAVAEVVGQKLRALGRERQVLCVTHLPQVAAQGHAHMRVSKNRGGTSTQSEVVVLDADGRVEELSRMLGGIEITAETTAHARAMLDAAQRDADSGRRRRASRR